MRNTLWQGIRGLGRGAARAAIPAVAALVGALATAGLIDPQVGECLRLLAERAALVLVAAP